MHIKISKSSTSRKPTPRQPLTPDTIAQAVQAYLASGGKIKTR